MVMPPSPTTTSHTSRVLVGWLVVVVVVVVVLVTLVEVVVVGPLLHDPDVLQDVLIHVLQLVLWYSQDYPPTPSSGAARK